MQTGCNSRHPDSKSAKYQYKDMLLEKPKACSNPACTNICYRSPSEVAKVVKSYCSRSCAVTVNNRMSPKRIKKVKKCDRAGCSKVISISLKCCSRACYSLERTAIYRKGVNRKVADRSLPTWSNSSTKRNARNCRRLHLGI